MNINSTNQEKIKYAEYGTPFAPKCKKLSRRHSGKIPIKYLSPPYKACCNMAMFQSQIHYHFYFCRGPISKQAFCKQHESHFEYIV
jgi:hypothetical protein